MASATIFEAKTNLSELIKKAQAGEKVIITSGRDKTPVVELKPIAPHKPQRLGFMSHLNIPPIPDSVWFDPLPDEWTGEVDTPGDPLLTLSLKKPIAKSARTSRRK
jgi:prevent-host-death family protein